MNADSQIKEAVKHSSTERNEEIFHDQWALESRTSTIDVKALNTACTSPEIRFIRKAMGNLQGRTILDLGAGLGDTSVYFAMEGAAVTALDISGEMLNSAKTLASQNGVDIDCIKASANSLSIPKDRKFDFIYAANLFHHVDINRTLQQIVEHLKPDGRLFSWDPMAYNPVINIYRMIATEVRTKDEHPLRLKDIKLFSSYFMSVKTDWFWLSTLSVFIIMALVLGRNPNRQRYWKKVTEESRRWAPIYKPLELTDRVILKLMPFLGPLCWNVVISAGNPKRS